MLLVFIGLEDGADCVCEVFFFVLNYVFDGVCCYFFYFVVCALGVFGNHFHVAHAWCKNVGNFFGVYGYEVYSPVVEEFGNGSELLFNVGAGAERHIGVAV